jgi:hypothetical protein
MERRAGPAGNRGVGVLDADRGINESSTHRTACTLVEKHANGEFKARIVGSIVEYLLPPTIRRA